MEQLIKPETVTLAKSQISFELANAETANPIELAKQLAGKYKGLTTADPDDKEGEKAMDDARLDLYRKRRAVINKAAELEKAGKDFASNMKAFAAEIVAPLEKEEKRLKADLQKLKDLRAKREAEEERRKLEKFNARVNTLADLGVLFRGDHYEFEGLKVTPKRIETATDGEWPEIVAKFQQAADTKKAREAEAERIRLENEELKRQLEALKAAQQKPETEPEPKPKPEPAAEAKPKQDISPIVANRVGEEKKQELRQMLQDRTVRYDDPKPADPPALQYYAGKYGHISSPNEKHFKQGYLQGVRWAQKHIIEALDTVKNRQELKDVLNDMI